MRKTSVLQHLVMEDIKEKEEDDDESEDGSVYESMKKSNQRPTNQIIEEE